MNAALDRLLRVLRDRAAARALSLATSMPAAGARQHDGASTRSPLISTMQDRQLPSGRRPGLWHSLGISTPSRSATSRIVSPGMARTSAPFSLNLMAAWSSTASCGACPSSRTFAGRRASIAARCGPSPITTSRRPGIARNASTTASTRL